MGHRLTQNLYMPFGKSKNEHKSLEELPSSYLQWLEGEEFFEEKYGQFMVPVQEELRWRTDNNEHFEED